MSSSGYTSYTNDGEVKKIVEVTTPYTEDDLDGLQLPPTQSADVVYLTHKDYQTRKLSRTSSDNTSWTLTLYDPVPPPTSEKNTDLSTTTDLDSITYSGTTATATISAGHSFLDDMYLTIAGANESLYNGTFQITNVTSTTFDYTMSDTPSSNATGSPVVSATTIKPGATTGDNVVFLSGDAVFLEGDVGRNIVYGTSKASISETLPLATDALLQTVSSITHSGTTATATVSGHGYSNGDRITIQGVDEDDYNGTFRISNKTTNTFDYEMDNNPGTDASGDNMICYKSPKSFEISSLTQSNNVATATTSSAHGYSYGDYVKIKNATEDDYNGTFFIYDVTSTTFKYDIENDPSSPATGNPHCKLKSPTNAVLCDISEDFDNTNIIGASDWTLDGSPQVELTFPSRGGGSNNMMKVTSDKHAFRTADVGKYIRFPRSDSGTYATFEIIKYKKQDK
ncbi:MAG: hypothetical protein GWN01_04605, partial [Nitrosopumilaceae archaeon]|nr:hypothetical protein [Nitrosopumilaceae archaeon]NIU86638.1 hypothetical protein [Nitrosopumilaceae archaeon]NIX60828.1 hypothetical protein [Nitrosopumilaceae archaeon]